MAISHKIHLQSFKKEYFTYFKEKVAEQLEAKFKLIRFYWKDQEVYIYLEENFSTVYVTEKSIEGFSARFYDIILGIYECALRLKWK